MDIEQLLLDSTDVHVHCAPDALEKRRVDALQLAQQACEYGMKHVVIKSHQFCTAPLAAIVNKVVNKSILIGSIVLNAPVGGLNPEAVRVAAKEGAKIIWLPTSSAKASIESPFKKKEQKEKSTYPGISVLDNDGNLVPEVKEIMDIVKAEDVVLATGHISAQERIAVANESRARGIKTILTHAITRLSGQSFTMEHAMDLAQKGAFIEFCFNICLPPMRMSPAEIVDCIKTLGADHCLLSTDLGQAFHPLPTEGFRMMLAQMVRFGLSVNELETIVKINPDSLLYSKSVNI